MNYVCVVRTGKRAPDGEMILGTTESARFSVPYLIQIGTILHLDENCTKDYAVSVRVEEVEYVFFPDRKYDDGLTILGVTANVSTSIYGEEPDGSPVQVEAPSLYSCWETQMYKESGDPQFRFRKTLENEFPQSQI